MYIVKTEGLLDGKTFEQSEKSSRPTLWEAVANKAGEDEKNKLLVQETPKKDWSSTVKTLGFWIGVFFPGAFYYFSLTFFTFIELFFAPFLDKSIPVALAIIFSGALYLFLRKETPNFALGLPSGIALLFIWGALNFSI